MNLKNLWGGKVSTKSVVLVALVSLVIGLGISASLGWLTPSRAVNFMGDAGNPESRFASGLPDFVSLAKKMRPVVVNISTVTVSEGRGGQEFSSPFGEEDPSTISGAVFSRPAPRGPQRQRSLGRVSSSTATLHHHQQSRRRERLENRREVIHRRTRV